MLFGIIFAYIPTGTCIPIPLLAHSIHLQSISSVGLEASRSIANAIDHRHECYRKRQSTDQKLGAAKYIMIIPKNETQAKPAP